MFCIPLTKWPLPACKRHINPFLFLTHSNLQKYWLRDPDLMFSTGFEPGLPSVNILYIEMSGVRKAHMIRPHSL